MPYIYITPAKKTCSSVFSIVNMIRKDPDVRRLTIIETFVNGSDDWVIKVSCDDPEIEAIVKAKLDLHRDMHSKYEISDRCGEFI